MAAVCHRLAENGKVAIVHIRAIKLDNAAELLQKRVSCSLNAQHLNHLIQVIGKDARVIHPVKGHHFFQGHALGVEHPLLLLLVHRNVTVRVQRSPFHLSDENLIDAVDALQLEVIHELRLDNPQEVIVVCLLVVQLRIFETQTEYKLLRVVVGKDDVGILAELFFDTLPNGLHAQILVEHQVAVKDESQNPPRQRVRVCVLVGQLVKGMHEFLVLFHDGCQRIRVVVNFRALGHVPQNSVLERALDFFRLLAVTARDPSQVYTQTRSLDVLRNVDDLLQSRNAQRDILRRDTSVVECTGSIYHKQTNKKNTYTHTQTVLVTSDEKASPYVLERV